MRGGVRERGGEMKQGGRMGKAEDDERKKRSREMKDNMAKGGQ